MLDSHDKKNLLVLYNHAETHVKTIADFLESFHRYSRHNVSYVSAFSKCHFDLDYFDAVIIHFSVRVCTPGFISPSFVQAMKSYRGLKVLFIQDEYDHTHYAQQTMRDLGVGLVCTCVPTDSIAKVYPPQDFPGVKFVNVLTGYVPIELSRMKAFAPLRDRRILIGYRGRNIGFQYGDLGQEKLQIGVRMKQVCAERGLPVDIAWEEKDRIYGEGWFEFLGRCKATLGTESGANVFDFDGTLGPAVKAELRRNPHASYEEIHAKFLADRDGQIVMNQISPKVFEAIACRTALVLFEGRYSDVLEPYKHYIPLKKDFSNVDDVIAKLHDDAVLETMVEQAYADVIGSGKYSYAAFVQFFDEVLEDTWRPIEREKVVWLPLPPCDALPTFRETYRRNFEPSAGKRAWQAMPIGLRTRMKRMWEACPSPVRAVCRPILERLRSFLKPAH